MGNRPPIGGRQVQWMGGVFYYPAVQYVDRSVITPTNPPLPLIRINWPDPTYLPSSAPILLSQYTASATQSTHPYSAYCPVPLCKIVDLQPRVCVTEAHEVTREVGETAGLVAEQRSQAVGRMECEVEDDSEDDEESVSVMGVVQPVFHADTDTATIEMASTAPVAPAVQPPVAVLPAVSAIKQEERRAVKPLITATCGPCTTPPLSASPLTSPSASMPAAEQGQTKAAEVKREERQAVRHTPPPAPAISVVATASTAPPAPPLVPTAAASRPTSGAASAGRRPLPLPPQPLSFMEQMQQQQRMRAARVAAAAVASQHTTDKDEEAKQPSPLPPQLHNTLPPPLPWSLASSRRRGGAVYSRAAVLEEKVAAE